MGAIDCVGKISTVMNFISSASICPEIQTVVCQLTSFNELDLDADSFYWGLISDLFFIFNIKQLAFKQTKMFVCSFILNPTYTFNKTKHRIRVSVKHLSLLYNCNKLLIL